MTVPVLLTGLCSREWAARLSQYLARRTWSSTHFTDTSESLSCCSHCSGLWGNGSEQNRHAVVSKELSGVRVNGASCALFLFPLPRSSRKDRSPEPVCESPAGGRGRGEWRPPPVDMVKYFPRASKVQLCFLTCPFFQPFLPRGLLF